VGKTGFLPNCMPMLTGRAVPCAYGSVPVPSLHGCSDNHLADTESRPSVQRVQALAEATMPKPLTLDELLTAVARCLEPPEATHG
jgi:hypothetical protein